MERVEYCGWKNCVRLTNSKIELVVTTEIGPRIIHFGFVGGPNMFGVMEATKGQTGGDEWNLYGGHRLWHSPEIKPRTYGVDNTPIDVIDEDGSLHTVQPVEPTTGVQKEMLITMADTTNSVEVIHRLTNHNPWAIELAPWALTVMTTGGEAIIPQPQGDEDALLPGWRMTMWPYTRMNDPRLNWGGRYIRMRQDVNMPHRCKIGLSGEAGWVGYAVHGQFFMKTFEYDGEYEYPDWGSGIEIFTNDEILEVESLGPLSLLEPGDAIEHVETWYLLDNVNLDCSEESIETALAPRVNEIL